MSQIKLKTALVILSISLVACQTPAPVLTQVQQPPSSKDKCGDGVCDGPETPFGTCPVEIADPPQTPRESACNSELDERSCIVAGGEWIVGVASYYAYSEE